MQEKRDDGDRTLGEGSGQNKTDLNVETKSTVAGIALTLKKL